MRVLFLLLLASIAWSDTVSVTVSRGGKAARNAWVTWDRSYGGGPRTIHGTNNYGMAEIEASPGLMWVMAFHERWGVVRKQIRVKKSEVTPVDLRFENALGDGITLTVVDDATGQPVKGARFVLLRSGTVGGFEGVERNRPDESKADDPERVLGKCIVSKSFGTACERLPSLFLRTPAEGDDSGKITLDGLLPGTLDGYVEAAGYAPQWIEGAADRHTVRLRRGGTLEIRSVPGRYVQVNREGSYGAAAIMGAEIGKDGRFVAEHLPTGQYRVIVCTYPMGPSGSAPWYDGDESVFEFGPIAIQEGKTARCNANPGAGRRVAGEYDHDLLMVEIECARSSHAFYSTARFRKYEIAGVQPGRHPICLSADGGVVRRGFVMVPKAAGDVEFDFVRCARIRGVVLDAAGKPVPEFELGAWVDGQERDTDSMDSGRFRVVLASGGTVRVAAWVGESLVARTVVVEDGRVQDCELRVGKEPLLRVDVELIGPDGEPCEGEVAIHGVPTLSRMASHHRFRLPPGTFTLVATARNCARSAPSEVEVGNSGAVKLTIRLRSRQ